MTISLAQLRRCSAAIDIGAARTRVYVKDQGLVVDEPTVAAINTRSGALIAVGAQAEEMTAVPPTTSVSCARSPAAPSSTSTWPSGCCGTWSATSCAGPGGAGPRLRAAVCLPYGSEPLAQRAAVETLTGLGARRVELVDTLVAAAVGCGLPGGAARGHHDRGVRRRRPRRSRCSRSARS